jgi:dephospho-CoA kinase
MKIFALTGSIGMGKSTAAAMLRRMGVPVYCADEVVHDVLSPGGAAVQAVGKLYPKALAKNSKGKNYINRKILGAAAFHNTRLMNALEKILHPLTTKARKAFLKQARKKKEKAVVLDIPLLFEKKLEKEADVVLVVSAPASVQKRRVLTRPGMTEKKFRAILSRQMPDKEKRKRADIVIPTGRGREVTKRSLKAALRI